jgi:hypothetical protein
MYYKPNPELCKNNNTFESNTCCMAELPNGYKAPLGQRVYKDFFHTTRAGCIIDAIILTKVKKHRVVLSFFDDLF